MYCNGSLGAYRVHYLVLNTTLICYSLFSTNCLHHLMCATFMPFSPCSACKSSQVYDAEVSVVPTMKMQWCVHSHFWLGIIVFIHVGNMMPWFFPPPLLPPALDSEGAGSWRLVDYVSTKQPDKWRKRVEDLHRLGRLLGIWITVYYTHWTTTFLLFN